jgi:transcriptional regulator with PAS, ATPase and Fis domain
MVDFSRLNLIGRSPAFLDKLKLIERFARCDHTVLIEGETGTGKELAARAIHYLGARRRFPFIPVNCGALPDTLVESEFFGHVRGAFTDAREASPGVIGQAQGGTLLLDEIEAMTLRAQVVLLRFLQDKVFRPIGGAAVAVADVRVIGATNTDLREMVRGGGFRADLLYRLNALTISLPPLRERPGDVMTLADHVIERLNRQSEEPPKRLHPGSAAVLIRHPWPGNVRELENFILKHYLLEPSPVIRISSADAPADHPQGTPLAADESFKRAKARAVTAFEQSYIRAVLEKSGGNVSLAARLAGKDRSDLSKLLRKHGIQPRKSEVHGPGTSPPAPQPVL